jgi:hypothetical protein
LPHSNDEDGVAKYLNEINESDQQI